MTTPDHESTRLRRTAEERRVEVIQAAIAEFSKLGLHGGSTETIAAHAGISQPYVLRLFKTKKALFLAAVEHVCQTITSSWKAELSRFEKEHPDGDVVHKLEAIGMAYFGLVQTVVELRLVLQAFASAEDDEVRQLTHRSLDEMFTWVQNTTGADSMQARSFFATGMLLTIGASIRAVDAAPTQAWARAYLEPSL